MAPDGPTRWRAARTGRVRTAVVAANLPELVEGLREADATPYDAAKSVWPSRAGRSGRRWARTASEPVSAATTLLEPVIAGESILGDRGDNGAADRDRNRTKCRPAPAVQVALAPWSNLTECGSARSDTRLAGRLPSRGHCRSRTRRVIRRRLR